ncbi:hypothetical protein [Microbispora sp. H11081]|uniref:hypothetical protein n=1 Tax=Microbispora sp. H11081 TaxID=2729107 RepID=UPI0014767793|nr:hypothetical protein [Microbispora sp. H11081]
MERTLFRLGLGGAYLRLMRKAMTSESTQELRRVIDGIAAPEGDDPQELLAAHVRDRKAYWARINHPSHRPEFWKDLLLAPSGPSARSLSPTVEAFIGALGEMVRVPGKEAAAAVAGGRPARARDGSRVTSSSSPRVTSGTRHGWAVSWAAGSNGSRRTTRSDVAVGSGSRGRPSVNTTALVRLSPFCFADGMEIQRRPAWRFLLVLLVVTLIASVALSVGVVWLLTLTRDWLLGQIAIVPFDPHW